MPAAAALLVSVMSAVGLVESRRASAAAVERERRAARLQGLQVVLAGWGQRLDAAVDHARDRRGPVDGRDLDAALVAEGDVRERIAELRGSAAPHGALLDEVWDRMDVAAQNARRVLATADAGDGDAAFTSLHVAFEPGLEATQAVLADALERERRDADVERERARRVSSALAVVLAGTALAATALGLLPLRALVRRLHDRFAELEDGAARLAAGRFDAPLPVRSDDELGRMARAFNEMAAELARTRAREVKVAAARARIAALEEGQRTLASTLRERTEELAAAHRSLVVSDRLAALGTLASGVAHEVNNPLAYVLANLRFVREEAPALVAGGDGPAARARLADVDDAVAEALVGAERVSRIVSDLRLLARRDAGPGHPVDPNAVLEAALHVAAAAPRRDTRLELELGPVPRVLASEARLGQVFLHLLANAAQAVDARAEDGPGVIAVRSFTDARGRAVVEIRDDGVGIPPEVRDRIFDPFFTTRPAGAGAGLGLSIVHGIVTALGGQVDVESAPHAGTCLRVILPPAPAGAALSAA